jgi:hypothetical protein
MTYLVKLRTVKEIILETEIEVEADSEEDAAEEAYYKNVNELKWEPIKGKTVLSPDLDVVSVKESY